jgi:hypothetical protein
MSHRCQGEAEDHHLQACIIEYTQKKTNAESYQLLQAVKGEEASDPHQHQHIHRQLQACIIEYTQKKTNADSYQLLQSEKGEEASDPHHQHQHIHRQLPQHATTILYPWR